MKYVIVNDYLPDYIVAPLVGAWIEIPNESVYHEVEQSVAPLVGAWIEMSEEITGCECLLLSLPSWERGLKSPTVEEVKAYCLSLPSWERGLKSARHLHQIML